MRALVTGATGFLGRHLVRALVRRGDRVLAVRRESSDTSRLRGLPIEWAVVDLARPGELEILMRGIDVVFHVAGHLSWWRGDRSRQWAVNVEGSRRVAEAALRARVGRLVYTSSVAAVGFPLDGRPADETFSFNGYRLGNPYSISKWEGEQRILALVRRGLDAVVVNPATILGDDAPRPGTLVQRAVAGAVPGWIDGGTTFCDVEDVVAGHLAAVERGRTGERYILGGHDVAFRTILTDLARAAGARPPRRRVPAALVRAAASALEAAAWLSRRAPPLTAAHARLAGYHLYYASDKARRELGYAPGPYDAMIRRAVLPYRTATGGPAEQEG
ncbi:NAD-dependent epimerase/dehydratase family protein [Carboxydochorda subterranea]|uniref:NAD-dependent epimerase/dehydratase family protein n=1 Tax=Carboxydichorda subterranea TaxID=3109565 RepID=A0ABZ1BXB5_9FIRM|nr:NAD-dependent epimerase/dehydratase family protein [Limnochorda sp. L945t]WRP17348.1 NAD-dependent epimerase/dehydratase family protein [Limnochorda sp. L945t]